MVLAQGEQAGGGRLEVSPVPRLSQTSLRNVLLRALPQEEYLALATRVEAVEVSKGDVVIRPNQPFDYSYFPESGLSSVLSSQSGKKLEVGLFGREGMVCFEVAGLRPDAVVQRLLARQIVATTTPYSPSYARLAAGLFTTPDEIETVLREVRALA